jgi:hypothetical protein
LKVCGCSWVYTLYMIKCGLNLLLLELALILHKVLCLVMQKQVSLVYHIKFLLSQVFTDSFENIMWKSIYEVKWDRKSKDICESDSCVKCRSLSFHFLDIFNTSIQVTLIIISCPWIVQIGNDLLFCLGWSISFFVFLWPCDRF